MGFLDRLANNIAGADIQGFLIFGGGLLVFLGVSIRWAFKYMVQARTLEDVPTSKARSAEQGYVEAEGHAELLEGPPVVSPLSGKECVWWSYTVERYGHNNWERVEKRTSDSLFLLRDATGSCIVDPEGADVFPEHKRTWNASQALGLTTVGSFRGSNYRYREFYLLPHELICVIGLHKTHAAIDEWDDAEELRRLLAEWKRNQTKLINRFDTNKDGVLDQDEWQAARNEARKQVAQEKHRHAATPGVNVIGAPPDRRPFLIAPLDNSDFARKLRWKAIGAATVSVLAGSVFAYILALRYGG